MSGNGRFWDDDPNDAAEAEDLRNQYRANGHANGHANGPRANGRTNPFVSQPWDHPLEPLNDLDFSAISDNPEFTREWAVPQWFPMLETTGFGGPGGQGKTLLAQMLGTAAVLGGSWLEMPVTEMKAALVLCEDRNNDAHWRQVDINRRYGCKMSDLKGRLKVYARRNNQFNYLGIFDRDGELHLTAFFDQLLSDLKAFGARLVVLDTRADVFRGNQNDEDHARTFVRRVTDRIAWELGGLVLLLFQPSRAGFRLGSGESGSVQWDASFRARCYLEGAKQDDEADIRHLTAMKSNYSATGHSLDLRWKDGVFVREDVEEASAPGYERAAQHSKAERIFLKCLGDFAAQGRFVSSSPHSSNFAPKLFAASPAAEGCKPKALDRVMGVLFHRNVIRNEVIGPPSKGQSKIVRIENG